MQACEHDISRGCPPVEEEEADQADHGGRGEFQKNSWPAQSCLCQLTQESGEVETGGGEEDQSIGYAEYVVGSDHQSHEK